MSADNGIYILVSNHPYGNGTEYRVIHAQAIENIFDEPNFPFDKPKFNKDQLISYFGKSRSTRNPDKAAFIADMKFKNSFICESGLFTFT